MPNMTINEAAEHFGVSKEAIHNRVRRGSLGVVLVDGVKYVTIDKTTTPHAKTSPRRATNTVGQVGEDRYYKLLEEQNTKLQEKVEKLEGETRTLREQKEQMLIDEREKIEQIYKDKDEQLKNILSTISSQFMLSTPQEITPKEEHLDVEIEEVEIKPKLISLKRYLKDNNYSSKKQEKIKKRFAKLAKDDEKVIKIGKKFYLDLAKYDYSKLLK